MLTVAFFHPKTDFIVSISCLDETGILFEMVALQGLMYAIVGKSAISTAVRK